MFGQSCNRISLECVSMRTFELLLIHCHENILLINDYFATLHQIQFGKYKFWINDVIPSVRNKLVANVIDFANVSNCFFWFHIMCLTFYMHAQRWLLAVDLTQYGLYKNDIAFMMTFALMLRNILMTHISCNSFQNYMMQLYFKLIYILVFYRNPWLDSIEVTPRWIFSNEMKSWIFAYKRNYRRHLCWVLRNNYLFPVITGKLHSIIIKYILIN